MDSHSTTSAWSTVFDTDRAWRHAFEKSSSADPGPGGLRGAAAANQGVGVAIAPGTCGELVQGVLNGRDFLITCPVDIYSQVRVQLTQEPEVRAEGDRPLSKTATAVERFLRSRGFEGGARIQVRSALTEGKGLASSSADIAAGVHAAAEALGADVPAYEVSRFAISVEPTDAVFYPGIVIYDQVKGELLEPLGTPPPLQLFIVDGGDTLDTLSFDRARHRAVAKRHHHLLERAVNLLRQGVRSGSSELVGLAATLSSHYHQEVRENALVEPLLDVMRRVGGVGVNVAHSGTVAGLMVDPRRCSREETISAIAEAVGPNKLLAICSLVGGGSRLEAISRAGLSPAQESVIALFGPPRQRIPCERGVALEFDHPTERGQRFYAFPDGTLHVGNPDPSHCLAPSKRWRRPVTGEQWEMKVVVVGYSEVDTRYLPVTTEPVKPGIVRVLPTSVFDTAFERRGSYASRRVRIIECDGDSVRYLSMVPGDSRGAEVRVLSVPIFLANYRLGQQGGGGGEA